MGGLYGELLSGDRLCITNLAPICRTRRNGFRERVTAEQAQQWMTQFNDKKGIEALVNHLHILDIQNPGDWQDVNETQVRFLGETLRDAWAAKLAIDFPNKTFTVEFIEGSAFNLMAYQVLFYQSYGV